MSFLIIRQVVTVQYPYRKPDWCSVGLTSNKTIWAWRVSRKPSTVFPISKSAFSFSFWDSNKKDYNSNHSLIFSNIFPLEIFEERFECIQVERKPDTQRRKVLVITGYLLICTRTPCFFYKQYSNALPVHKLLVFSKQYCWLKNRELASPASQILLFAEKW